MTIIDIFIIINEFELCEILAVLSELC